MVEQEKLQACQDRHRENGDCKIVVDTQWKEFNETGDESAEQRRQRCNEEQEGQEGKGESCQGALQRFLPVERVVVASIEESADGRKGVANEETADTGSADDRDSEHTTDEHGKRDAGGE